jgi:glycosyltransferase involved in cell wall biosynthesis
VIAAEGQNSLLVIVPALNEEGAIGHVVESVRREMPGVPVLVIDDCSTDATVLTARQAGAEVISLPRHLGLGGCVQTGYKLAYELGFEYVVRVDGDGQHDARDIPKIYARLVESGANMVIGSRFVDANGGKNGQKAAPIRGIGIQMFRWLLRIVLGKPVRDPTSGFVGVNRTALQVFSRTFPLEYPEIEALVVLQRRRFRFEEVPCRMLPRRAGKSSITASRSFYYIVHVLLGIVVNVLKYDARSKPAPDTRRPL